jgi:glycosyltransferase involved in cell wall biosynthesis
VVPAERIGAGVSTDCRPLAEHRGSDSDTVLYHLSTSSAISDLFPTLPGRRIVRYHNITPAEFFDGYDDAVAAELRRARSDLRRVVSSAHAVCAVSAYNAGDLAAIGLPAPKVVPLLFSPDRAMPGPDPAMLRKLAGPVRNILFVGRVVPNKRVEELILAFAWYSAGVNPRSRLILAGSERSCPRYYAMLRTLAGQLGLANVCFEGFLSDAQLAACYRAADVFVTASRHEGYCAPLLEALSLGVPVIAREAGGMPEALGGSGVLFEGLEPRLFAELIHRVLDDPALRKEILDSQTRRLAELRSRDLKAACLEILEA